MPFRKNKYNFYSTRSIDLWQPFKHKNMFTNTLQFCGWPQLQFNLTILLCTFFDSDCAVLSVATSKCALYYEAAQWLKICQFQFTTVLCILGTVATLSLSSRCPHWMRCNRFSLCSSAGFVKYSQQHFTTLQEGILFPNCRSGCVYCKLVYLILFQVFNLSGWFGREIALLFFTRLI